MSCSERLELDAMQEQQQQHRRMLSEPRSTSSCSACKLLKRRCSPTCIFAPYFRYDEPTKFAKIHKVFGASNVSKILAGVPEEHRQDSINSLVYEADMRLRDPVYGCIGAIVRLQRETLLLQHQIALARARLACHVANSLANGWSSDGAAAAGDGGGRADLFQQNSGHQLGQGGQICMYDYNYTYYNIP